MAKKKASTSDVEMKIVYRRLDAIKPLPGNAKLHDLPGIIQGISDHGFVDPVLVSVRTMHNLDGNGRWEALALMHAEGRTAPDGVIASNGHWLVPTLDKDCDEPTERILALSLNRLNERGGYDQAAVLAILNEANALGRLEQTGYDSDALAWILAQCAEPDNGNGDGTPHTPAIEPADAAPQIDRAKELNEKWQVAEGDLWTIGEHMLICGDSTKNDAWHRLLTAAGVEKVDGIFTSPPYADRRMAQYGGTPADEYLAWWEIVQRNAKASLKPGGSFFVNIKPHSHDGQRVLYVMDMVCAMVRQWGWLFVDEFCWRNTSNGVPGRWPNRFKNAFEPIYHFAQHSQIKFAPESVGHESDGVFDYHPSNQTTSRTGSGFMNQHVLGIREGIALPSNVIEAAAETAGLHSAPFPVKLPDFFIRAFSFVGDVWIEPFAGSGTTIVAAQNNGRRCLASDWLPGNIAVCLERMATAFPDLDIRKA